MSLDAPGPDFISTIQSIFYLRNCVPSKNLIRQFVTFHLFFNNSHVPQNIRKYSENADPIEKLYKCPEHPPYLNKTSADTYNKKNGLQYQINLARNLAIQSALTYFIFPCDIELYPSLNVVPQFFDMIANNISLVTRERKYV